MKNNEQIECTGLGFKPSSFTVTAVSGSKAVKASEEPVVDVEEGQKTITSANSQLMPIMPILILAALIPTARCKNGKQTLAASLIAVMKWRKKLK